MRRVLGGVVAGLLLVAGAASLQVTAADAVVIPHRAVVNVKAAANTPHVGAGTVYAFAQVGNKIIVGGSFASVTQTKSSAAIARSNVFAYNASTGVIDSGFRPVLDGEVSALQAGPDGASVYVGGKFNNVNGVVSRKLAKLSTTTGAAVSGFKVPAITGPVNDFALAQGRLLIGGQFAKVGGIAHYGLASLNPATGALDPYMSVHLYGHHNYTGQPGEAFALTGVYKFDVTPDGSRLVAVGNFKYANGLDRDQLAVLDLGATSAAVANWQTDAYKPTCHKTWDAWIRDVSLSPDGSYFAVVGTGGPVAGTVCDTTARWETRASGAGIKPTWVNFTGGDSLYSVAVTGSAVYIGGHMRWVNNTYATDSASYGAVGRAGIAALDPVNGLPLSWNPGRNPRGRGAYALHATPSGLFVGSDTDWIGNRQYYHGKFAFFPVAGGKVTPPTTIGRLPGKVYQAGKIGCNGCGGNDSVMSRTYDGASAVGADKTVVTEPGFWSNVRGAVLINGELWFGSTNGYFYKRSFNGTTFGPVVYTDPYNDPYWSNVSTGRGTTYRGKVPAFYLYEIPYISSMFYTNGRLYYTLVGQAAMYYRYFSPESGVIGTDRFTVPDGGNWSGAGGSFLSGNSLFVSLRSTGALYRFTWDGTKVTAPVAAVSGPAIDGRDWRANAMFLR